MYARDRVYPRINSIDQDKVEKLYADLRRESMVSFILIVLPMCFSKWVWFPERA